MSARSSAGWQVVRSATSVILVAQMSAAGEVTVRRSVSIKAGTRMISAVSLTNTHARTYVDSTRPPMTPNQCGLSAKDAGVVWRVVVEGAEISPKEVKVVDERGQPFVQVCWSSSGSVYTLDKSGKRIGGGPRTEFLAAGPESPKAITFTVGDASATFVLAK